MDNVREIIKFTNEFSVYKLKKKMNSIYSFNGSKWIFNITVIFNIFFAKIFYWNLKNLSSNTKRFVIYMECEKYIFYWIYNVVSVDYIIHIGWQYTFYLWNIHIVRKK